MMTRVALWLAVSSLATGPPSAAADVTFDHITQLPMTYIRDYGDDHLDNPEWVARVAANAPELLVVGKDLPIHHNWGPVQGVGGENQAYGQGEHIRRISPEELEAKMAAIRRMVRAMRECGVQLVMPYICSKTIGGDHWKRTGFWEFYDRWDEYIRFGIGPRPADDPERWMRRRPDGSFFTTYPFEAPYYAPNFRYAACGNQPGWRTFLQQVVRLCAECDYDGVYMDNNGRFMCYCDRCQEDFRAYLSGEYKLAELRRLFGFERPEDIRLGEEPETLLWYETRRFWAAENIEFLRSLKAYAEQTKRPFHIFANLGTWSRGWPEIQTVSQVATFIQSEENGEDYGGISGLARVDVAGVVTFKHYNYRALQYKYTQATRSGLRVTMTTRPRMSGSRRSFAWIDNSPHTVGLNLAEAAAFGGEGAYNTNIDRDTAHQVAKYRKFLAAHRDLYEGCDIYAPVGVLCFAEQRFFTDEQAGLFEIDQLTEGIFDAQVVFDLITERNFTAERLARYPVVVLPQYVRYLSDDDVALILGYIRNGGTLVLCGTDAGTFDKQCVQRERWPFERLCSARTRVRQFGKGRCIHYAGLPPEQAWRGEITEAAGSPLSWVEGVAEPGSLKVNAYVKPDSSRVVVHLVNYEVPLGRDSTEPPTAQGQLTLRVPLPEGKRPSRAVLIDPDGEFGGELPMRVDDGVATLTVPGVYTYAVVSIQ